MNFKVKFATWGRFVGSEQFLEGFLERESREEYDMSSEMSI